jgi:hypothetical protein
MYLSNSQKIGAISLIFKKIHPLSLDNYRPITLLNTDTKILAYTIAQRLKEVLFPQKNPKRGRNPPIV